MKTGVIDPLIICYGNALLPPEAPHPKTKHFCSFALTLIKRSPHSAGFFSITPVPQGLTGILPIFACQIFGAVSCTDSPFTSTATETGMSCTSNS
jgi:hypothetical protein